MKAVVHWPHSQSIRYHSERCRVCDERGSGADDGCGLHPGDPHATRRGISCLEENDVIDEKGLEDATSPFDNQAGFDVFRVRHFVFSKCFCYEACFTVFQVRYFVL